MGLDDNGRRITLLGLGLWGANANTFQSFLDEEYEEPQPIQEGNPPEKVRQAFERNKTMGRNHAGLPTRKGKGKGRLNW